MSTLFLVPGLAVNLCLFGLFQHIQSQEEQEAQSTFSYRASVLQQAEMNKGLLPNLIPRGSLALPDFPGLFKFQIQNFFQNKG